MSTNDISPVLVRVCVVEALTHLHSEWVEAANGLPLNAVRGNIGLLLDDVMDALGLSELEKGQVRGYWTKGFPYAPPKDHLCNSTPTSATR